MIRLLRFSIHVPVVDNSVSTSTRCGQKLARAAALYTAQAQLPAYLLIAAVRECVEGVGYGMASSLVFLCSSSNKIHHLRLFISFPGASGEASMEELPVSSTICRNCRFFLSIDRKFVKFGN